MGMYTGLRCKVKVKEEYRQDIEILMEDTGWSDCNHDIFKNYSKIDRAVFIPFGALSYMPDEWEKKIGESVFDTIATDGFNREFNKETGVWTFQCSLKNYSDTIYYFINDVLTNIVEEVYHLEELYEENEVSDLYEFKDGKIERLDYGIIYPLCYEYDKSFIDGKNIKYCDYDFSIK